MCLHEVNKLEKKMIGNPKYICNIFERSKFEYRTALLALLL